MKSSLELSAVRPSDLPERAVRTLYALSTEFTEDPALIPPQFDQLLRIDGDGVSSYVAEHVKTFDKSNATDKVAYIVDLDDTENELGFGEIRFSISRQQHDRYKDKPFVGWTRTIGSETTDENDYRRHGLGRRRLFAMNLASRALYDLPLHSGDSLTMKAERLWWRLTEQGYVMEYLQPLPGEDNEHVRRYQFKE